MEVALQSHDTPELYMNHLYVRTHDFSSNSIYTMIIQTVHDIPYRLSLASDLYCLQDKNRHLLSC
jgi:hypothetical protein